MLTGDFYPQQIGGQGIYAFELTRKLAGLGATVKVFAPATSARREFAYANGVRVRWLGPATQNPLVFSAAATALRAEILDETDVLHVNELFGFPFAWRLPGQQQGMVVASHNAYLDRFHAARGILAKLKYPPLVALEGATYRFADRVLIGSEIERAPLLRLGVAPERIILVPYGVDAARFEDPAGSRRAEVRRSLGISPNARVVLFVGRFVERKKPHVVVRALKLVRTRDPDVHGILVGDGELMPRVREAVGSDPGVHLVGAVSFSELPRYYAAADAFTLPSIGEGSISLVVLEAAAAGLPLVLTLDSSGQSPVFDPKKNGELVSVDDPESLADAILVALEHRDAYGAFSRGLVERHFSWETAAQSTILCYEAALRARSQRVGGTKHDSNR
jgi:glycosyltransferase involved in cell wall biosynthesis